MDPDVNKLLLKFPELVIVGTGKALRVRCSLSGHEMPSRVDVVKSYVHGKKFTTLKMHSDFDYASLEPFLIPSQKRRYQLFCTLTSLYVNRIPAEVRGHLSGRRYKRAMLEYKSGERKLREEFSKSRHQKQKRSVENGEARHENMESDSPLVPPSKEVESHTANAGSRSQKARRSSGFKEEDNRIENSDDDTDDEEVKSVPGLEHSHDPNFEASITEAKGPDGSSGDKLCDLTPPADTGGVKSHAQTGKTGARPVLGKRRKRERYMAIAKKLKAMKKRSRDQKESAITL